MSYHGLKAGSITISLIALLLLIGIIVLSSSTSSATAGSAWRSDATTPASPEVPQLLLPSAAPGAQLVSASLASAGAAPTDFSTKSIYASQFPSGLAPLAPLGSAGESSAAAAAAALPAGASAFSRSLYSQDPSTMSASSAHDVSNLAAYLPSAAGMTSAQTDPDTGLPVFTAASLNRANALGGRGMAGFLQPVVDPMRGLSKNIKNIVPTRYTPASIAAQQAAFMSAQQATATPVLFGESEYMYAQA